MAINWIMFAALLFPFVAAAVIYLWMRRQHRIIQAEIAKDMEESRRRYEQKMAERQARGEVDAPPKELTPEEFEKGMIDAGWKEEGMFWVKK